MAEDSIRSVCLRCAAWKELPLGRCPGCGHVPLAREAAPALLASTRMIPEADLVEVQRRLARGESLSPSRARLAAAQALLRGEATAGPARRLSGRELAALAAASFLLTPFLPLAVAFSFRDAPAGRQALALFGVGLVIDGVVLARLVGLA